MLHTVSRILSVFSIALLTASSAPACINDRDSPVLERQFKSDYLEPGRNESSPGDDNGVVIPYLAGGSGAVLLVAGLSLAFLSTRPLRLPSTRPATSKQGGSAP